MLKSTLVIAGGSQGTGASLAEAALKRGMAVAVIARRKEFLETLQKELGSNLSIHQADLSDVDATAKAFQEIASTRPPIRALVNCAATWFGGKTVEQWTAEDMANSFKLNFLTTFNPIQEVLKAWRKTGGELAIVNLGATASLRGRQKVSPFAVAKGAVRQLSQSLARELGPEGVHVAHVILDGLIDNARTRGLNPEVTQEKYLNPASIAKSILNVIEEDKSCWTHEWDLRPSVEKW